MDTLSSIRLRQWSLIGVNMVDAKMLQVFINSKLEIQLLIDETKFQVKSEGSIYFGGDPWHKVYYKAYLDEIKMRANTLSGNNIILFIYKILYIVNQQLDVMDTIY